MRTDQAKIDLTVFAKDYPEIRLVVEVKNSFRTPQDLETCVRRVAQHMWGANCHFGLIFTPITTYVLRDDFTAHGPESIHIAHSVPTDKLLGRQVREIDSEQQLERLVRDWLELLATSYETALPDDPQVLGAFFPDIVGAVAEGRVVAEASF